MPDATAVTESAKRKWAAPHIIEAEVATESEVALPAPGADAFVTAYTSAGVAS